MPLYAKASGANTSSTLMLRLVLPTERQQRTTGSTHYVVSVTGYLSGVAL